MDKAKLMKWLKLYKSRIIAVVVIAVILTAAFFAGGKPGDGSGDKTELGSTNTGKSTNKEITDVDLSDDETTVSDGQSRTEETVTEDSSETENTDISQNEDAGRETDSGENHIGEGSTGESGNTDSGRADGTIPDNSTGNEGSTGDGNIGSSAGNTDNTAGNTDASGNDNNTVNPPTETVSKKPTCTISISCATILNNMDKLDRDKKDLVPKDGWILKPITVEFEEGETVFDLLKRICMDRKIHMESSWTPMYNSAYIEGIHNLYEFDCGSLSGWMYSVNGVYPNYGCSKAVIKEGDVIKWVYTCDLGKDV